MTVSPVVPHARAPGGHPADWDIAVRHFLDKLRGDNCSPATLETYRTFLMGGPARAFRDRHGISTVRDCDAEALELMKQELLAAGLRASTVHGYVRMWRTFLAFCLDRGWGVDAKVLTVRPPRLGRHVPQTFSEADQQALLAACRSERDRVMVHLILDTAIRRSEVANLTIDDVVWRPDDVILRIRGGKGDKDRAVPVSALESELLAHYLRAVRPRTDCRALFLTLAKVKGGDYGPLGAIGVYQVWRRLSQATGVRAYPHKGRHTAATRWAQNGTSPWAVQHALGHTTPAATNRYVDASAVDLSAAFRQGRGGSNGHGDSGGELTLIGSILKLIADKHGHQAAQELLQAAGIASKFDSPPPRGRTSTGTRGVHRDGLRRSSGPSGTSTMRHQNNTPGVQQ